MSKQLRELQARKATLVKDARALTDIAASEERDMTDEELNAFNALKAKIEASPEFKSLKNRAPAPQASGGFDDMDSDIPF